LPSPKSWSGAAKPSNVSRTIASRVSKLNRFCRKPCREYYQSRKSSSLSLYACEASKGGSQDSARLYEHPGCNWGLATGQASGVFVLEVDTRSASSALRILCEDVWDWQQTLLMRAGDAGYAFFRWPAGRAMCGSGENPAPGLRIRGGGDYVLIPPSVCSSGASYVYPRLRSAAYRPAAKRPSHAARPILANLNGKPAAEPICDCSPASSRTAACADTCRCPDRAPSARCRNQPGILHLVASR
jgi:hypothetical protein